jgi:acyl-CoA dehydrogenase
MLAEGKDKEARPYSSMAKLHVARALCKTLDDAIQMHGGLGYSRDMPFGDWYRSARAARIADGPDEVHSMVIARDFLLGRLDLLV